MGFERLKEWSPINFDAAGFLTLLGAFEVNLSVGRLVRSRWLEFMPLLAPFVFLSNQFRTKQPGFDFYNITNGIHTTNLASWFTRFLSSHADNFPRAQAVIIVQVLRKPVSRRRLMDFIPSLILSVVLFAVLFTVCALARDWFGFASTAGVLVSVVVRFVQIEQCRNAIDHAVRNDLNYRNDLHLQYSKGLIRLEDNNYVTLFAPPTLSLSILINNPELPAISVNRLIRYGGWIAFLIHIVALNSATLTVKIITTAWLILSTIFCTWKVGCEDSELSKFGRALTGRKIVLERQLHLGTLVRITLCEWPWSCETRPDPNNPFAFVRLTQPDDAPKSMKAMDLFARLCLSENEITSMEKWDLLPHRRGGRDRWWESFQQRSALFTDQPPRPSEWDLLAMNDPNEVCGGDIVL